MNAKNPTIASATISRPPSAVEGATVTEDFELVPNMKWHVLRQDMNQRTEFDDWWMQQKVKTNKCDRAIINRMHVKNDDKSLWLPFTTYMSSASIPSNPPNVTIEQLVLRGLQGAGKDPASNFYVADTYPVEYLVGVTAIPTRPPLLGNDAATNIQTTTQFSFQMETKVYYHFACKEKIN